MTVIAQVAWHYGAKYKKHLEHKKNVELYNEEMREKRIQRVESKHVSIDENIFFIKQRLTKLEDKE